MKTFDIVMLMVSSVATGMNIATGKWIMMAVTALCTTYWLIKLLKKSKETTVTMSDETKEYLVNNGIKVVVNGMEVI